MNISRPSPYQSRIRSHYIAIFRSRFRWFQGGDIPGQLCEHNCPFLSHYPGITGNKYYSYLAGMWYQFLNIFFFVFHTVWTLFNAIGWIFPRYRRLHLYTMLLTASSWFILGIWYGWGYCACTHWHWLVREKLGYHDQTHSYIHFMILKLTGAWLDMQTVEYWTLAIFLLSFGISIWLNIRDARRKKRLKKGALH